MKKIRKYLKDYDGLFTLTLVAIALGSCALILFVSNNYEQIKQMYNHSGLKWFLIFVLAFIWLTIYVVWIHRQFVKFIKYTLKENLLLRKDMNQLNKSTRKLIILHKNSDKEDGVA